MSATGTILNVAKASCGDNLRACWRVWFNLDDPHALADVGAAAPAHPWMVDLPRDDETPPCDAGDRITVSTTGRRSVTIERAAGGPVTIRSEVPGPYDPERRVN